MSSESERVLPFIVEVCVDSVESAEAAVRGGADRLELCGNLGLGGGTTPSIGMYQQVKEAAPSTTIMVMIRPRTGDFLYSLAELKVMLADIRAFKAAGADGVVFGCLSPEGRVDIGVTMRLVQTALPMQVCFHRAFDMTRDAVEAFSDIAKITGITRVLTSGLGQTAVTENSLSVIVDLLRRSSHLDEASKMAILPGSGINPRTVKSLLDALIPHGLSEIHLSAGRWTESAMRFRKGSMGMGIGGSGEWGVWSTNADSVRAVRKTVDLALANHSLELTSED